MGNWPWLFAKSASLQLEQGICMQHTCVPKCCQHLKSNSTRCFCLERAIRRAFGLLCQIHWIMSKIRRGSFFKKMLHAQLESFETTSDAKSQPRDCWCHFEESFWQTFGWLSLPLFSRGQLPCFQGPGPQPLWEDLFSDKCQLWEGPMTKPRLFDTKWLQKVICVPSQAKAPLSCSKPPPLSLSCSCVSGALALYTSSHAGRVCDPIHTIDFLSDQPCATLATHSNFRGATVEKRAISDCMNCKKQDGHCQILPVAKQWRGDCKSQSCCYL